MHYLAYVNVYIIYGKKIIVENVTKRICPGHNGTWSLLYTDQLCVLGSGIWVRTRRAKEKFVFAKGNVKSNFMDFFRVFFLF